MSDIREALQTLRDNIREEGRTVQQIGIRDNRDTRDAIAVLLDNEAALQAALQSQTAPAVPEGWKLVPVEPTDDMLCIDAWYGSIDISEQRLMALWADMLAAAPAADGGEVVPDSEFSDEFAKWWEDHGQFVRAGGGDYERTFAFEAWRHLYPRITAPTADAGKVGPADDSSTVYRIGDLGNQIHNLGCSHQNNEELADSLAELAHQAWVLQRDVMRDLTATHPAQPRNEIQAAYGLHHVSRMYQVMRTHDSTIDDVALDSMRDVLREVLATRLRSNGGDE